MKAPSHESTWQVIRLYSCESHGEMLRTEDGKYVSCPGFIVQREARLPLGGLSHMDRLDPTPSYVMYSHSSTVFCLWPTRDHFRKFSSPGANILLLCECDGTHVYRGTSCLPLEGYTLVASNGQRYMEQNRAILQQPIHSGFHHTW